MSKQVLRTRVYKNYCVPHLLLLFLFAALFSCKKQKAELEVKPSPQIEDFLKLPANAAPELIRITSDLRSSLEKNDFTENFLTWHGQPLWARAIVVKGKDDNFSLYVPTKKENDNKIATYFIATYRNGKFLYEMHRRSSLNSNTTEHSIFNYSKRDFAKTLAYFDHVVLNKRDTIFLNNTIDTYAGIAAGSSTNKNDSTPNNSLMQTYCWTTTQQVPCGSFSAQLLVACYGEIEQCVTFEDGGGGGTGGGGAGSGGTGGGGGGGGGTGGGSACPFAPGPWYSLVPEEDPCGPPPPPSPANDTILDPCADINSLESSASFISYLQELKDSVNGNREYGYLLYKDPTGLYGNTPLGLIQGPENKLSLGEFVNYYLIDAMVHLHFNTGTDSTKGLSIFSPDDLWTMCTNFNAGNVPRPEIFTMALVTKAGTQYLLKIENLTKFRKWSQKFTEGSFDLFYEAYGKYLGINKDNTNEINEKRFLTFLKLNGGSGLKIFKGNSSFTNWSGLGLNSNGDVVIVPCN